MTSDLPELPSTALDAAVRWIELILTGSLATASAILAVAGVGALMLAGHLSWRRGSATVLGCFILFSASIIARELAISSDALPPPDPVTATRLPADPAPVVAAPNSGYDPYGSVSVPGNAASARDVP